MTEEKNDRRGRLQGEMKEMNIRGKKVQVLKGESGKLYHIRSFSKNTLEYAQKVRNES